jgi:hypothetical protein
MSLSISILVTIPGNQEIISHGAVNDDICKVLRKLFNPALKGPTWDALLCALAAGDQISWDNARLALNQLTLAGATGIYLDKRASDVGVQHPENVGLSDDLFRRLAIVVNSEKLTQEAVLDVLEVFYGKDAVSASITSDAEEIYRLQDNDSLRFILDQKEDITVIFKREEFAKLGEATAAEVAATITRACINAKSQGYAVPITDPTTGINRVRIYSGRLGLTSSVQILGGDAQRHLLFPQSIFDIVGISPFATWTISLSPTTEGNIRFTETSGIYNLQKLIIGDLVYLYGPEFIPSNNFGVFEIQNVLVEYTPGLVQWFEITNPFGSTDIVTQILFEDVMFFRPIRETIYDQSRRVIVAQTMPGLNIEIPATTLAVGRTPGFAAYLEDPFIIGAEPIVRVGSIVTVTTPTPNGLEVGDQFFLTEVTDPDVEFVSSKWVVVPPTITPGTPSPDFGGDVAVGTTDSSISTTISEADTFQAIYHRALRLPEGIVAIVGGETQTGGISTTLPNPVIFEITSDVIVNNARQQTYKWTRLSGDTLTIGRRDFGATVLQDGRLLLTGGHNSTNILVVAPTNVWNILVYNNVPGDNYLVTGVMPVALGAHGQGLISDGHVLISGGWTTAWTDRLKTTYIMNPNTFVFTAKANMKDARVQHEVRNTKPNFMIAIGGRQSNIDPNDLNGTILNTCEVYDVLGDSWTRTGSMTYARFGFDTVTLLDGRIIVIGGIGYNPSRSTVAIPLKTIEIYDPLLGFWANGPSMSIARDWPNAEYQVETNSIIVSGGLGVTSVEILNLDNMTWSKSPAKLVTSGLYRSQGAIAGIDTFVVIGGSDGAGNTIKINNILVQNQDTLWNGGLNVLGTVESIIDPNNFTFTTPDHVGYTSSPFGFFMPAGARPNADGAPGPWLFDPKNGASITSEFSTLAVELEQDQHYSSISVVDATVFPDAEGYLVFNFGYENEVRPVKYIGRLSNTELALDAGFKFPVDIEPGATVILLKDRNPFIAGVGQGQFYLTDSASGRVAAQAFLDDTVAAGIDIFEKVIYPGDRGLGAEGFSTTGPGKLSDLFEVFGGNDLDIEVANAHKVE